MNETGRRSAKKKALREKIAKAKLEIAALERDLETLNI